MNTISLIPSRHFVRILTLAAIILCMAGLSRAGEWEPLVPVSVGNVIEIQIKNLEFTGSGSSGIMNNHILIIPEGLKVQWVNADPLVTINGDQGLMPHGIKISDTTNKVLSASSILNRDQNSFSYTFTKEGSYSYSCFIHPFMTGKIQVINLPGVNLAAKP